MEEYSVEDDDGTGGPSSGRNADELERLMEAVKGDVDRLMVALDRAGRAIDLGDQILRMTQPPVNGKIGVQWWLPRGGAVLRLPVLVRWHVLRSGRWRARKIQRLRRDAIRSKGTSSVCVDETYDVAVGVQEAIVTYRGLLSHLTQFPARARSRHTSASLALGRLESVLRLNHSFAVKKLLNAGYDVDAHARDLPDAILLE